MDTKIILIPIVLLLALLFTVEPLRSYADVLIRKLSELLKEYGLESLIVPFGNLKSSDGVLLSKDELKLYNGKDKSQLYLAVVGSVFDVTKGAKYYSPENHYGGFTAKDGTRAFVTGQFDDKGLIEDISDFSPLQMYEVYDWEQFYHKSYSYVGKVIGHYYDENGEPTEHYKAYQVGLNTAKQLKKAKADDRKMFPPCNSEWTQQSGSRVWCTTKSGGINREWVGVPRKYHKPGEKNTRCACIKTSGPPSDDPTAQTNHGDLKNPNLQEYKQCPYLSESCDIIKD